MVYHGNHVRPVFPTGLTPLSLGIYLAACCGIRVILSPEMRFPVCGICGGSTNWFLVSSLREPENPRGSDIEES
jgi:hypothetical protein